MTPPLDFRDVRGNLDAVAAVVEAARARFPLLLVGPAGCGKTMLAARFAGLLPPMDGRERAQVIAACGKAGLWPDDWSVDDATRPFRAPHHSVSERGLRGEAELARHGVLFLDEFELFTRAALVALVPGYLGRPGGPWLVLGATMTTATARTRAGALRCLGVSPVVVPLLRVDPLGDGERWPPTAELQEEVSRA